MKICFVGAGALGSAIGGTLAKGGSEVFLVDLNKAHVDAINRDGLIMREGGIDRPVKARAATDYSEVGVVELVIILVKSNYTQAAIESARSIIGPNTVVMSLQNGLGHEDVLAKVVGKDRLLAGKTYVGGVLLAPGHVIAGVAGKLTYIGELDGSISPRATRVAEEFKRAGLNTIVSSNIVGTIWDKLLINVATGAISGITRLPYGGLYKVPEVEAAALAAVAEAMAVAKAQGVVLSIKEPRDAWVMAAEGLPFEFKTSMLQSLERGLTTEVDFINGSVVRAGKACGIPTPVNETLVACVKGIEHRLMHFEHAPASVCRGKTMVYDKQSYVEHVAIRVKDIQWHIRFFREVLGMTLREVQGDADAPKQVWTIGGVQLTSDPAFEGPEGRIGHIGVMTENLEAALQEAEKWGVTHLPQGRNWLRLPDGLCLEVMQAHGPAVSQALAINPRD